MSTHSLGNRLKAARESLGLSLSEAAQRLGFASYQTLSKIENDTREVKASELSRFSKVYFLSISSLLTAELPATESTPFLWRNPPYALSNKKEIEAEILSRCRQYHLLEQLLNIRTRKGMLDISSDDVRTNTDINLLANRVRDLLGLGSRPAFSLQKVLEQDYGIKVLYHPFSFGSAVSMQHPSIGPVIVINSDEAPWRRNFDLAHELFHLLTWHAISLSDMEDDFFFSQVEKKADKFASILLLPENEIRSEVLDRLESQQEFTYSDIVDIAIEFGVSAQALLYRLAYLKLIKWDDADETAHDDELTITSRELRKDESQRPAESERLITLAIRCLRKGLISRGKFAEIMDVDRCDIDGFIQQRGLLGQEGDAIEIMVT